MATKYVPGTTNAILIGDKGTNGAPPTPTKVGSNLCSAVLELQSTTRGFLPPRMTTAQINAIAYPFDGMRAYNTTLHTDVVYVNGVWVTQNTGLTGDLYAEGTLTVAQVQGMYANPVTLIAAPGALKAIIVKNVFLNLIYTGTAFADGGVINMQYASTPHGDGLAVTPTIESLFLTVGASGTAMVSGNCVGTGANPVYLNSVVSISNKTAAFTGGAGSTVNWKIWYSIVSAA